jgi:hypothetical protein
MNATTVTRTKKAVKGLGEKGIAEGSIPKRAAVIMSGDKA